MKTAVHFFTPPPYPFGGPTINPVVVGGAATSAWLPRTASPSCLAAGAPPMSAPAASAKKPAPRAAK